MGIMAAGMHDLRRLGSKRESVSLGDGKRVDVRSPQHTRPGAATADKRRRAGLRDGPDIVEPEAAQVVEDHLLRPVLFPREFRVAVQVAPDREDVVPDGTHVVPDLG
ncbi:MAG: hypothetical protein Kow0010_20030 [Dehalococcoidia bacterium]